MKNRFTAAAATISVCLVVAIGWPSFAAEGEATADGLALALARNEIPAGLVVPDAVMNKVGALPSTAASPTEKAGFRERLDATVKEFNARKQGCEASLNGTVVHVRDAMEPSEISELLERRWEQRDDAVVPAMTAVNKYVLGALRGAEPTGGVAGIGMFPGEECPIQKAVKIAKGSTTALQILDEIVKQAPGLVWFVSYKPESPTSSMQVGLMCPDGATVKVLVSE